MLRSSGITKEEASANPEIVVKTVRALSCVGGCLLLSKLEFHAKHQEGGGRLPPKPPPRVETLRRSEAPPSGPARTHEGLPAVPPRDAPSLPSRQTTAVPPAAAGSTSGSLKSSLEKQPDQHGAPSAAFNPADQIGKLRKVGPPHEAGPALPTKAEMANPATSPGRARPPAPPVRDASPQHERHTTTANTPHGPGPMVPRKQPPVPKGPVPTVPQSKEPVPLPKLPNRANQPARPAPPVPGAPTSPASTPPKPEMKAPPPLVVKQQAPPGPVSPPSKPPAVTTTPAHAVIQPPPRAPPPPKAKPQAPVSMLPALEELVSDADPAQIYTDFTVIGAGASGSVYTAKVRPSFKHRVFFFFFGSHLGVGHSHRRDCGREEDERREASEA